MLVSVPVDPLRADSRPWTNRSLPPGERAALVVARMTLDEKIGMVHGAGMLAGGYVGYIPANDRLGIPAVGLQDGPAGVGDYLPGVTVFPAPIAAAATWDMGLVEQLGAAMGEEQAAKGVAVALAPTVNILRVPQWGRAFEGFSEDPFLAAAAGVADVNGIQSKGVIASVKHYAAYNQELDRMHVSADVSERALEEIYLPAFKAAVQQAHVGAVMTSYNRVNSTYAAEHAPLLRLLKDGWGFDGFVVSDWYGTHSTAPSALAGLDLEMPDGTYFGAALRDAVRTGRVPVSVLDDKVRRILTQLFRFGFFDRRPTGSPAAIVSTQAHRDLAQRIAEAGTVLLKNHDGLLPFNQGTVRSIAVIGEAALVPKTQGCGSAYVSDSGGVSPARAITARAGKDLVVRTLSGFDRSAAAKLAAGAEVAVVVVSDEACEDTPFAVLEGSSTSDRPSLRLPGNQDALVESVAKASPHTVVVLDTSGAVEMPWLSKVDAVLEAWYPGHQDGAALAAVLFGDAEPGGRLPVTFPRTASDGPTRTTAQYPGDKGHAAYSEGLLVGYRWYDAAGVTPLFPFGFGLSYTTFDYHDVVARASGDGIDVAVDVTNTGRGSGSEVVQLYLGSPAATGEPPRQLKGFHKVTLAPGVTTRVRFHLGRAELSSFDPTLRAWTLTPGRYTVQVGASSRDIRGSATVTVPR